MTKVKEQQFMIRQWKDATGNTEIDMHQVAQWASERGWPIPPPLSGIDRLAKEFAHAAREETRQDGQSGREYRVYHAFHPEGGGQGYFLWMDIDEAPRNVMVKSTFLRREQVIGDMVQLEIDLGHWNRVNPSEEPIVLVKDLSEDVAERLAGPDADQEVA